ncbi:MAG: HNH endonuclease [Gammaproteobacteria bacterium]
MNPRYEQVALRAGHRCEYCHAPEVIFNFPFDVEHIIPVSRDGVDAEFNWALSCRSCNLYKSSHTTGVDPERQIEILLFHPREDRWERHFRANTERGEIQGTTAIGRATVIGLEMNSQAQVKARKRWMDLGLFP